MHQKQVARAKIAEWFRRQGRDESDLDGVVEQVLVANQRAGVYLRQLLRAGPNDPLPPEGWVARYHMRKSMCAIELDVLCLDWGPALTRLVGWRMRPDYEIHPEAEMEFATWCQDGLGYIPGQELRGGKLKFRSEADRLLFTFRWLGVPRSRN